jgi:hypothetical protein
MTIVAHVDRYLFSLTALALAMELVMRVVESVAFLVPAPSLTLENAFQAHRSPPVRKQNSPLLPVP